MLQRLCSRLLLWRKKSIGLATPKFSLELVFLVTWKKFVKTALDRCCLGFRPKPEASNQELSIRNFKNRNWLCIAFKEPFGTITLAKPGFGGKYGWQLSQT